MAIIHHKNVSPYIIDYVLHDNRNISLVLRGKIGLVTYTGTHTPHAEADDADKTKYYVNLENIHRHFGQGQNIHFIGGDFNARLIERAPAEEDLIGPFIFNPASDDLNILSEGQLDNRKGS